MVHHHLRRLEPFFRNSELNHPKESRLTMTVVPNETREIGFSAVSTPSSPVEDGADCMVFDSDSDSEGS